MVEYCQNTTSCRHLWLMKYFDALDESFKPNLAEICPKKNCDICKNPKMVQISHMHHLNPELSYAKDIKITDSRPKETRTIFKGFEKASKIKNTSDPSFEKASFFKPLKRVKLEPKNSRKDV